MTARWSGFSGAPGYSNFHFGQGFLDGGLFGDEAQAVAQRVADAFDAMKTVLPAGVRINIEPSVQIFDEGSGVLEDFAEIDPIEEIRGGTQVDYAGPVGAVVNWRTNDVRAGRRIRGRTFLVPLASEYFDNAGSLTTTARQWVQSFANAMIGNELQGDFGIWARPINGAGGVFATVTSGTVPDLSAVLRSRRD